MLFWGTNSFQPGTEEINGSVDQLHSLVQTISLQVSQFHFEVNCAPRVTHVHDSLCMFDLLKVRFVYTVDSVYNGISYIWQKI